MGAEALGELGEEPPDRRSDLDEPDDLALTAVFNSAPAAGAAVSGSATMRVPDAS